MSDDSYGFTVTIVLPGTPSTVAVIVAVPCATAVTTPVDGSTVATEGVSDDQVTVRPDMLNVFPPPSFGVAVSVTVSLIAAESEGLPA